MAGSDSAPYEDRGYILEIVEAITLALAFTLLGSRLYVRFKMTKNPGWDDFFIVLAMIIALVGLGMADASVHYGLGRHIYSLPDEQITPAIKWDFVQSLPLGLAAMFTKISIFIFLRRLFVNMHTKWTWTWTLHFVNGVNIAANIASATTVLAQCTPIAKLWDPTVPGSCWPPETQAAVGIFQGASSAFCDWAFASLPIVFLWNVHISVRIKVGICSLMGLGFFTAICAIVRTIVANTENYDDFTYNDLVWNIWFDLETICGIIAACLPTIRPLLKTDFIKSHFSKYSSSRRYAVPENAPHHLHDFGSSSNLQNIQSTSGSETSKSRVRVDSYTPHPPPTGIQKTTDISLSTHSRSLDQDFGGNHSLV